MPQCCVSQASAAGSFGPSCQDRGRHRQQHVQVERTRQAAPDQRRGAGVMRLHPVAELPRQDAAAGHRQRPLASGLGDRTRKNVLLEGGAIEPPRDHP